MYLRHLYIHQFKNYVEGEWEFTDGVNFLLGDNGTGKTNILDAIHYLSFCKSYFNPVDTQCIRTGEDVFMISGHFELNGNEEHISCTVKKGQRKIFRRNRKEYEKLSDHIGLLPAVMVTPYDTDLIHEGSEVRRRFVDTLISQYSRPYLDRLILYNKALQQRNALLTSIREGQEKPSGLEPWDMVLADHGAFIHEQRKNFFAEFLPLFRETYDTLCARREESRIEYVSDLYSHPMEDLLARSLSKDIVLERTTCGIHKDDILISLGDQPLKKYGSQGQQKTLVISLKIAQFHFLRQKVGVKPILMLDDIFDKIDDNRVKALMALITDGTFGQVFITDTSLTRVPEMLGKTEKKFRSYNTNLAPPVREKAE